MSLATFFEEECQYSDTDEAGELYTDPTGTRLDSRTSRNDAGSSKDRAGLHDQGQESVVPTGMQCWDVKGHFIKKRPYVVCKRCARNSKGGRARSSATLSSWQSCERSCICCWTECATHVEHGTGNCAALRRHRQRMNLRFYGRFVRMYANNCSILSCESPSIPSAMLH